VDQLCAWDAANLPVRDGIVDAIISDLPFGHLCMSTSKLHSFFPLLMFEMARVLRPESGRMVRLCGSFIPILEALQIANKRFKESTSEPAGNDNEVSCSSVFPINTTGNVAWVIIVQRGNMPGRCFSSGIDTGGCSQLPALPALERCGRRRRACTRN
jgi:hypothetical protein